MSEKPGKALKKSKNQSLTWEIFSYCCYLGFNSTRGCTATTTHGVKRKRRTLH